ncbi:MULTISPECIES: head completion/stabilization protein [unclassified Shewanella]|uniref:head completion/stabilization protein n=1 Tax=unclassified Shewanella TaxID=196818 RepID=UPI0021D86486|nr:MULTISPECIES: head completion/stabilization protein [unclassified Shewanella]MCU8032751.1 head completion/stabilization protein [Shewanella sp. SM71]MCU8094637.1 head completion/stabilization protein [Shewanella sp. SM102]
MSGFGFQAPAEPSIVIDAASGWPELSTGEFRELRRIPEFFSEKAIEDSLNRSVAEIQQQILHYVTGNYVTGNLVGQASTDTDVPFTLDASLAPNFSAQQISIYRGAVYARSHADLLGYFSAVDQKDAGNNKAQDVDQQQAILAQSNRGVRLLLGLGRAGVHSL